MMYDATCTIFNFFTDDQTVEGYFATILRGVKWTPSKGATVTAIGMDKQDGLKLMVPAWVDAGGKNYLTPKQYAAATITVARNSWTISDVVSEYPDFVIFGIVNTTGLVTVPGRAQLKRGFDGFFDVTKVDDKRYASARPYLQHWTVGGN